MKQRLIRGLALVGLISIVSTVLGVVSGFRAKRVETGTIVTVDFEAAIVEQEPPVSLRSLGEARHLSTRDVVDGLRQAASDDRVTAIVADVAGVSMGLAQNPSAPQESAWSGSQGAPSLAPPMHAQPWTSDGSTYSPLTSVSIGAWTSRWWLLGSCRISNASL